MIQLSNWKVSIINVFPSPFSGIGKGLVGVVTRPTSGVIDFASSSLDSIRRWVVNVSVSFSQSLIKNIKFTLFYQNWAISKLYWDDWNFNF